MAELDYDAGVWSNESI